MSHKEAPWPMSPLSATYAVSPVSSNPTMPRTPNDNSTPTYNHHDAFRADQEWARRDGKRYNPGLDGYDRSPSFDVGVTQSRRKPWWMFGFEKRSSIPMCEWVVILFRFMCFFFSFLAVIFFGGAILGFSLSRTMLMHFNTLLKITTPGKRLWGVAIL